jgi:hypothetical protein
MGPHTKKSLAAATILFAVGVASQASAQSVSTVIGPKQMGAVDTSGCVATGFPTDPNARSCGYIPAKPQAAIAQINSNQECVGLMRRVIPSLMHVHFDFSTVQLTRGRDNDDGTPSRGSCVIGSLGPFDSSGSYPSEIHPDCTTTTCGGNRIPHGGLFQAIIENFKLQPEYIKIPNSETRLMVGTFITGSAGAMSDCSSILFNVPQTAQGSRLNVTLVLNADKTYLEGLSR